MSAVSRLVFSDDLAALVRRRAAAGGVDYPVRRRASIKDVVESLGVPHTEVYSIEAHGRARDFAWLLEPGCRVLIRGAEPPVDVTRPSLLRPRPLAGIRFVVDENVARLAPLLRLVGLDAEYDRAWRDERIAGRALEAGRVVLSRDRALLKRSAVVYGRLVRSARPWDQLVEVLGLFGLLRPPGLLGRCLRCNLELARVDKSEVMDRLEPKTKKYYDQFYICPGCGRVYWRGSHCERMLARLKRAGVRVGP